MTTIWTNVNGSLECVCIVLLSISFQPIHRYTAHFVQFGSFVIAKERRTPHCSHFSIHNLIFTRTEDTTFSKLSTIREICRRKSKKNLIEILHENGHFSIIF